MNPAANPPARTMYRKLAAGMTGVLLLLAVLAALLPGDIDRPFTVGVCLFVAFVMATIASTGHWPAANRR